MWTCTHMFWQLQYRHAQLLRALLCPRLMESERPVIPQPIYATPEQPRALSDQDLQFIQQYTGQSATTLRHRILSVWQQAKQKTFVYMCIQEFGFLKTQINRHPSYKEVLAVHKSHEGSMLHLDIGAAFGQDARRLLLDGWSTDEVIAVDVINDYWQMGKTLFMDENLAVPFVSSSAADSALPSKVKSLRPHSEGVDFIWAGLLLHCMPQADCAAFLKNCFVMLKPGGILYGMTGGKHDSQEWTYTTDASRTGMLYSPLVKDVTKLFLVKSSPHWAPAQVESALQAALETALKDAGFSEASTQPLNWEEMTTGTHSDAQKQDLGVIAFFFAAVR